MAKLSKKGISTLLVLLVVVSLLSLTMFSCTIRMAQKDSTYIDMGKAHLLQLETPADDAPAMIVHTSVGDITAVLYPEVAPNYVAQFTELVEKGYYDGTYVYQTEPGVYFRAGSPNADGTLDDQLDESRQKVETETSADLWPFRLVWVRWLLWPLHRSLSSGCILCCMAYCLSLWRWINRLLQPY